jgi:serine/threonine protein kinase/WD40 repeat protein
MNNIAGQHIKGYELHERIGAGGFGAVYRAFQSTIGREVAMKIILPGHANHPDFIRRFEAEAHVIARLEHPYIVPLHDYWRDPDGAYLVMRYLRGGSLHDSLQKQGAFPLEEVVTLMEQVTQALHVAHRNQVIHRDIKPGNILMDEDGNAYLADFGIAKDHTISQSMTDPDGIIGSPDYLAPEQARSEPVTPQTDIYSLGVVLFELLEGTHPFPAQSPIERLYKHLNQPLPDITALDEKIREAVNEVIQKATAKNPQQRFKDVIAFAQALREAAALDSSSNTTSLVELLTPREQEVLKLLIEGKSNREIADALVIEVSTVKSYINQLYRKLNVRSRVQAIVKARELDLIVGKPQTQVLSSSSNLPEPENPYKGLRAFQAADAQDFFGREKLIQKLLKRLHDDTENHRFLAVVGPSGSGKSSVVKAGLIPALWRGELANSDNWYIVDMLPGNRPLDELEVALLRVADDRSLNLHEQLERDANGLLRVADLILPDNKSELLLVIDQFEEIFTLVEDENERLHFLNLLHAAVSSERSRVRVIVTLRADYYDRPLQYPDFGELIRNRLETILPLSAEELEHAVREPASAVAVRFEDGLVSRIVADVHYQPGALPLLQYALTELFERRDGRMMTQAAYEAIGGTGGALANRADEIYLEQDEAGRELIRQIFLRLVTLGEGAEDTRRRVPRSELLAIAAESEGMDDIIDTYVASRLLSLDNDPATRTPTVEVAHEAILREWERLRTWLNESREDIRQQRIVAQASEAWKANKRDASYLLSGTRLEQVEKWHQATELAMTPLEHDFIAASISERATHQKAEGERQAWETRLEQRSRNFLRGLVAVFAIAALVAIGLSVFSFNQLQRAETQTRIAQSRELVGYVQDTLDSNGELSTLLALHAVNMTYLADGTVLPEAENILHQAVQGLRTPVRITDAYGIVDFFPGFSPDGTRIVYALEAGDIFGKTGVTGVADARTGQFLYQVPGDVWGSYISATNQVITGVFVGDTMELQLWDISSSDQPTLLSSVAEPSELWHSADGTFVVQTEWMSVSQDLRYLFASMAADGRNRIWDLTTGEEIVTPAIDNIPDGNGNATFSPDGTWLANFNYDDLTISILDTTTWEELVRLPPPTTNVIAITGAWYTLSPNGERITRIITDNTNTNITVWDTTTGAELYNFYSPIIPRFHSINADGSLIAIAAHTGQVMIWNVTIQQEELTFGTSDDIRGVAFSPDSARVASIHGNGQLLIWDLMPEREALTLVNNDSDEDFGAIGLAYSPDGQRLIATGPSTTPNIWDVQTGQKLLTLTGHSARVTAVAWSADGTILATAAEDTAIIWDATTASIRFTLTGHTGRIYSIAFSPDSNRLVTSSFDTSLRIWNVQTGELELTLTQENAADSRGVAWSPDGLHIANTFTGFDAQHGSHLYIRNALTGEVERDIALGDVGLMGLVAYNPDGTRILATLPNMQVYSVWDAQTGEKVLTLPGHGVNTTSIAFSPDGTVIATGGLDNWAQVWDANTGELLLDLFNSGMTNRLAISPDGSQLAIQDDTSTTWIYVLQIEDLIALAESRLTRSFTVEECQQYLHTDVCPTAP